MRSEVVHRALEKVNNRYLLCHATAKTTRCIIFLSGNPTDAISDAFVTISYVPCLSSVRRPDPPGPAGIPLIAE